ncbi:RHS repeat-associated core domain-containing protein [Woeseia oceani]|uniref:Teneurin-like YD-shell domain-containing protein n=1 Tax=Woeseia oceani TaxID=1548547 RepID=A0A193LJM2_9GAMM|nr:RHS repeat-associated core domain-containing protein [Woeseia oceani]ANO52656.1 hypothetical protein BA177_16995 [Woeseia oceani]
MLPRVYNYYRTYDPSTGRYLESDPIGLGQRVRKDTGTVTLFVYDDAGQLIGEYDAFGNPLQETVWFEDAPVAVLQGSGVYYVHTDHLGTPRAITDAGTVIWRWESEPFGTSLADEDPDGDLVNFTFNGRFPGQYFDAETGLHYNYFRTYDPSTGRYLESDPIGLWGGTNTYEYVYSNPLIYYDPYGLWAFGDPLPQGLVDGATGFGDGLSGGITSWIGDRAGIDCGVDKCSAAYRRSQTTGNATSLTLGGGRLVYAGLAKGYSLTASSGAAASAGRSQLRRLFDGGGSLRPPNLSQYTTDAALRAAAGRTNPYFNAAGAAAAGLGANDLANGDECECSQ